MEFAQFGSGSGLHGLPGDCPPIAVCPCEGPEPYRNTWQNSGGRSPNKDFTFSTTSTFPLAAIRDKQGKTTLYDTTWYTVAAATTNKQSYFHTHDSSRIRAIDLAKMNLGAKDTVLIPMKGEEDVQDVTPAKK